MQLGVLLRPTERSFLTVLTVAVEVGWTTSLQLSILHPSCRRVCEGSRQLLFYLAELSYCFSAGSP